MTEIISKMYSDLIDNSAEFRQFVKDMEKYSTEELKAEFEQNLGVICPYTDS